MKLVGWSCGSRLLHRQAVALAGLGSLANATFSVWLMPLETPWPIPVKSPGLPISQIAAAQATTIHTVPSMVRVPRLRISPCQASQIAPMMTTTAR